MPIHRTHWFPNPVKNARKAQQNNGLGIALDPVFRGMVASEFDHVWPREWAGKIRHIKNFPLKINGLENCAMLDPWTNWALGVIQKEVDASNPQEVMAFYLWKCWLIFKDDSKAEVKVWSAEVVAKSKKDLQRRHRQTRKVYAARRASNTQDEINKNVRRINHRKETAKTSGGKTAVLASLRKSFSMWKRVNT